jgi:hypothetical protein
MSLVPYGKKNYFLFKFICFFSGTPIKKNKHFDKTSSHQPVRGHVMKLAQFNQPVHCAICNSFIWYFILIISLLIVSSSIFTGVYIIKVLNVYNVLSSHIKNVIIISHSGVKNLHIPYVLLIIIKKK